VVVIPVGEDTDVRPSKPWENAEVPRFSCVSPLLEHNLGWQQQVFRVDRIELIRPLEAMGLDDSAVWGAAKQPILEREYHLLREKSLRADAMQDHHLIAGVAVRAGARRHGLHTGRPNRR